MNPMERQPVHVVYGGAHLFKDETCRKLGAAALRSLDEYAPNFETRVDDTAIPLETGRNVYPRDLEKLRLEPIEDYRIDFEDGYGIRTDEEEDGHAQSSAEQAAKAHADGSLPPLFGIRIKPFEGAL